MTGEYLPNAPSSLTVDERRAQLEQNVDRCLDNLIAADKQLTAARAWLAGFNSEHPTTPGDRT